MKVTGLNGREYSWNLNHVVYGDDRRKRSSLHIRCREILNHLYPLVQVHEEVQLPGSGNLTLDFYIPNKVLAIECHGEQHYKFIPHFHDTVEGFMNSRKRDNRKIEWCELNGIELIELPYDKDDDDWTDRIKNN